MKKCLHTHTGTFQPRITADRYVFVFTGGSGGRRETPIWQAKLFLLPGPDNGFLPPTIELEELAKHGLGKREIEADKN